MKRKFEGSIPVVYMAKAGDRNTKIFNKKIKQWIKRNNVKKINTYEWKKLTSYNQMKVVAIKHYENLCSK